MQWEIAGKLTPARKVPIFYYDGASFEVVFTTSIEKVRNYLPHPDLHSIEHYPDGCLVIFSAYQYRKTDADPYNEYSIAIMVTFQ